MITFKEWMKNLREGLHLRLEDVWNATQVAAIEGFKATAEGKPVGISTTQADHLIELVVTYRDAEIEDSWKSGGDPADKPAIEAELARSWKALTEYIALLQAPV